MAENFGALGLSTDGVRVLHPYPRKKDGELHEMCRVLHVSSCHVLALLLPG
jgi:hypothetical protein